MKKRIVSVSLLLVFWISCEQHDVPQKANTWRIISLSPNITETIYAIGAQDVLVGVSDYCNYPPQARKKIRIGGLLNPNLERIISLRPNLFLATPASGNLAARLSQRGIRCVLLSNERLQDIFTTIDSIGTLCKMSRQADSLINVINDSLAFFRQRVKNLEIGSPAALFVLHRDPGTTRNIAVIGSETFTDDLWRMLGGRNAFSQNKLKYAQINTESLLSINPDLIIEFKFNRQWDEEKKRLNKKEWKNLRRLKAVQEGQIYVIDGDYSLIPGPRIVHLMRDYYRIMEQYQKSKK